MAQRQRDICPPVEMSSLSPLEQRCPQASNTRLQRRSRRRSVLMLASAKTEVHLLRSVDNLFVVVEDFHQYQFKESKEETLTELQQLASNSPGPTPWRSGN
ncbi:hypothetical protein INR49_008276 [Caranx melampygus]|nr:hypothetical protein INR49_008276 [Caranx melampygus]